MINIIAFCAAIVSASISIPQFLLVVRTKRTDGLSVITYVIGLGTGIGWLCHGLRLAQINLTWPNMWGLTVTITVLYFLHRNHRYQSLFKLVPGLLLGLALVSLDNIAGSLAFGLAVIWPSTFGMIRQGMSVLQTPKVTGVAIGSWVLQVLNQMLWLIWAVSVHETGTMISAAVCLGPAIFVLTARVLRERGMGPIRHGVVPVEHPGSEVVPAEVLARWSGELRSPAHSF